MPNTAERLLFWDKKFSTRRLFDMPYQHGRVFGDCLSVVGHDVLESEFVCVRLPLSAQTGDTIVLTGRQFQYSFTGSYRLICAFVVLNAHEKGATDKLMGILHWIVLEIG